MAVHACLADCQLARDARVDQLQRLGRSAEAAAACDRAIGLVADPVERALLQQRRPAQR